MDWQIEKNTHIPVIHRILCSSLLVLKTSRKSDVSGLVGGLVLTMAGMIQIRCKSRVRNGRNIDYLVI
jgi:hypothetical protein